MVTDIIRKHNQATKEMRTKMNVLHKPGAALALVAIMGVVSQASAADLVPSSPPLVATNAPVYAAPTSDLWTGFYAGVHGGAGLVNMPAGNDRDVLAGIQGGYNYQFGNFVVGGELEGSYNNGLQHRLTSTGALEQTWTGTAKARAGVAVDNFLLFGTVGVASARLNSQGAVTSPDRWATGLAFGGGVEMALTEHLSGKLEYTQTRFNDVSSTIAGSARSDNLVNHAIKAGLNYRF